MHICKVTELSRENKRAILGRVTEEVLAVKQAARKENSKNTINCKFCGTTHDRNKKKYPVYGKKCKSCKKKKTIILLLCAAKLQKGKTVHTVTESDNESYEDILCVTAETVNTVSEDKQRPPSKLYAAMSRGNGTGEVSVRLWS